MKRRRTPANIKRKTAGKHLPEKKRKTQFDFKKLFERDEVPLTIFHFGEGRITHANQKFLQITGIREEELEKVTFAEFDKWVEPSDHKLLSNIVKNRMNPICREYVQDNSAQICFTLNFHLREKTGKYTHVLMRSRVVEWNKKLCPEVIFNSYADLTGRMMNHKMVLAVSIYDKSKGEWINVLSEEFLREPEVLTEREIEVMKLITNGKCLKHIAKDLCVSYNTIRTHCHNILKKTNCRSKQGLHLMAREMGWV